MATRMYLWSDGFFPSPSWTSTPRGGWDNTGFYWHCTLVTTPLDASATFTTRSINTAAVAQTYCHYNCVSPPMSGSYSFDSTVSATVNIRMSEASTSKNCFQVFYCGILQNDGTLIQVSAIEKDGTELGTSLASRENTNTGKFSSYISQPGDRLFVEIGFDQDAAVSGNISSSIGDSSTSGDLLGAGDTGVQNPWFEISLNVAFDAEGTTYGGNKNQLMMMGCGT